MKMLIKMLVATVAITIGYVLCNIIAVALFVLLVKIFG